MVKYPMDLIGERFGKLVIVSDVPTHERKDKWFAEYVCKCDCGNVIRVRRNNLISNRQKSCGCSRKDSKYRNAITGKKFGRLLVESEVPNEEWKSKKKREYYCRCDCGNVVRVRSNALLSGNTKSCGCLHSEMVKNQFEDLTGQVFGELTAIKRVESVYSKSGDPITRWLFKCSCGRELILRISNVKNGATKSCGHVGKSLAEYEITKWLTENNIHFDIQATFPDLKNEETNRRLKFDFKVYRHDGSFFIIEHHGIQHFRSYKDDFGKLQRERTDKIKKDYCKINGIALYETLYNEDYIAKLKEIIAKELRQDGGAYEKEVMTG